MLPLGDATPGSPIAPSSVQPAMYMCYSSIISQASPERVPAENGLKFGYTVEKYLRRYLRSVYNDFSGTNRLGKGRPA